jgi:hypothetical protein
MGLSACGRVCGLAQQRTWSGGWRDLMVGLLARPDSMRVALWSPPRIAKESINYVEVDVTSLHWQISRTKPSIKNYHRLTPSLRQRVFVR